MSIFYTKDMFETLVGRQVSDERYFGFLERFVTDNGAETIRFFEKPDLENMIGREISDIEYVWIFEDFIMSGDDLYTFVRTYPFNSRQERQEAYRQSNSHPEKGGINS